MTLRPAPEREPRRGSVQARRTAVSRTLGALLAATLLVGGCAQIPTDGPVRSGDVAVSEVGPVFPQVYGPTIDASPLAIVGQFINAQAGGQSEDWSTAREYLAREAAESWDPAVRTTVYSGELELVQSSGPEEEDPTTQRTEPAEESAAVDPEATETAVVDLQVSVTSTLDGQGRFTEAPTGSSQDLKFTLEKDAADQWRIVGVEDGTFVSTPIFTSTYRATSLYFPTRDRELLVPEVRWYPRLNTGTYAVQGLLEGPSDWLRDSVLTFVPEGTRLVVDSVTTANGTAVVDLTQDALGMGQADRGMLRAQLEAVLLRLPGIRSVGISVQGVPLTEGVRVAPERDPIPAGTPWVLDGGVVSVVRSGVAEPVPDLLPLTGIDVTALAVGADATSGVYRAGAGSIATLPTTSSPSVTLVTGTDLAAPSIDRFDWVWTADAGQGGGLLAISPAGERVSVTGDWLADRTVEAVRVSHDAARVAVVSSVDGVTQIDVAAIVRDVSQTPLRLSDALTIGAPVEEATQIVWLDESTVGVLARGASSGMPTVHVVPLSGRSEALAGVDETAWIAAGRGTRSLYIATTDDELFARAATGATWSEALSDVRLPAYPG